MRGNRLRYAGFGALIGIALAIPQITSALTAENLTTGTRVLLVLVAILAGLVAGEIAAFGLKKL